jgi:hypothetical protein
MSPPPPHSDLALGAEGGRERALDMATNSPKLECFFKVFKKSKYIYVTNCQLGRQQKKY